MAFAFDLVCIVLEVCLAVKDARIVGVTIIAHDYTIDDVLVAIHPASGTETNLALITRVDQLPNQF